MVVIRTPGRVVGRRWISHRLAAVAAGLFLATAVAVPALAQPRGGQGGGGFGMANMWAATVDNDDLEHMSKHFTLDEDQQLVIGSLIDGYRTAHREGVDRVREQMRTAREESRGSGDWQVMREVMEKATTEWRAEAEQLEVQLMADIQSMLTPEQAKLWPTFERDRLRRGTLSRGSRLSGEGVDVMALVEEMELPEDQHSRVDKILQAYASELDPLLKERNRMNEEMLENLPGLFDGEDPTETEKAWKRLQERRIAIRTLNQQYVEAVAAQLPLESGERLRREFQQDSFPRIYRPTEADRYLEQVVKLESITPEQVENLTRISEEYDRQIQAVNAQLAEAEREMEESGEGLPFMMRGAGGRGGQFFGGGEDGTGGGRPDPGLDRSRERMSELRDHKELVVEQQLTAIFAALTPEQQAQAPKPDPRARRQEMMDEMRERRDERMRRMRGEEGEAQGGG